MKPWTAMIAVLAVGAALLVRGVVPGSTITLDYVYSTDAKQLFETSTNEQGQTSEGLINAFNASGTRVGGHLIRVAGRAESSGTEMLRLAEGSPWPTLWTPASRVWGDLLGERTQTPAPPSQMSVVTSPQVFAVWRSFALEQGWIDESGHRVPGHQPSWADVMQLAVSHVDGTPPSQDFKLGHTNPEISTSGVYALLSEYQAANGGAPLTADVLTDPAVRSRVARVEQSILHYGDTSKVFGKNLCAYGQAYISAVYLQETTVATLNADPKCRARWGSDDQLVAIYPSDGTYVADYPVYVSPTADQLTRDAATEFLAWLRANPAGVEVASRGFRAGDMNNSTDDDQPSLMDLEHGIDPAGPVAARRAVPDASLIILAQQQWSADRKPARIALVVNVSTSMDTGHQLEAIKAGLTGLVGGLRPGDEVSLTTFTDKVMPPILALGEHSVPDLEAAVASLTTAENSTPMGGSALYAAIRAGYGEVASVADRKKINAVIVVTDGPDSSPGVAPDAALADLLRDLERDPRKESLIPVFTVALTDDGTEDLEAISAATGGLTFDQKSGGLEAAVHNIPSYF